MRHGTWLPAQIQSGKVRYEYSHAISNASLLHDRRVSITFRQNALQKHNI